MLTPFEICFYFLLFGPLLKLKFCVREFGLKPLTNGYEQKLVLRIDLKGSKAMRSGAGVAQQNFL